MARLCRFFKNCSEGCDVLSTKRKADATLGLFCCGACSCRKTAETEAEAHEAGNCQGWGRGFESPRPLQFFNDLAPMCRPLVRVGKQRVSTVINFMLAAER